MCVIIINLVPRGTKGEENGFEITQGGESVHGAESKECRGGEGAAAPEQWLGKLLRLCVNQPGFERDGGQGEWRRKSTGWRAWARDGK